MNTDDGQNQKMMMRDTARDSIVAMSTFSDIMSGPHPLTKSEIAALHAKRPQWSFLSVWY